MRIRPFKGKWVSRKKAKKINDMLLSAPKPDRTALEKESEEFIDYIRKKRAKEILENTGSI